jgi:hypothetical protein
MTKNTVRKRDSAIGPTGSVTAVGGLPIAEMNDSLRADIIKRKLDESQSTAIAVIEAMQESFLTRDAAFADGRRQGAETQHARAERVKQFVRDENRKLLKNPHLLGEDSMHVNLAKVRAAYIQNQLVQKKLAQANGKPHAVSTITRWITKSS